MRNIPSIEEAMQVGARLVQLALLRWSHVSDRAFRVLVRMAVTALDDPQNGQPAGLYFGGRDLLASVIRSEGAKREVVYRTVSRAIAELIKAGAIERTNAARSGENQVYALRLDSIPKQTQGVSGGHPQGVSHGHPEGVSSGPPSMSPADTPRNQEEPLEELQEEPTTDLRTDVAVSRARADDSNSDFGDVPRLRLVHSTKGNGFCLACYAAGRVVVAVDEINGDACKAHQVIDGRAS